MDLQNRWVCWRKGSTKPWDRRSSGFLTLDQIEPGRTFFLPSFTIYRRVVVIFINSLPRRRGTSKDTVFAAGGDS